MKRSLVAIILLLGFGGLRVPAVTAHEFSGFVAAEGRYFFHDPLFLEQERNSASIAAQPEYYHEYENGSSLTATLFARIDSADPERSHFDIREFMYLWLGDSWELRLGIGKVFWGVTEFVHLVDIINQTDLVEDIDGEDKLGQPMVNLSLTRAWGIVDFFVLPYFRERTFPGPEGRLRTEPPVGTDNPEYESGAEQHHVDFAIRYSHSLGNWDFGIYNFTGTGREPTLVPDLSASGEPALIPFYEQINQTGLDIQLVMGNWLLKLEALYRTGQADDFFSSIGGFEYTFVNIAQTGMDLSLIGEWAYDERGREATTSFQNDAITGLRLAVNDAAGTELLVGFSQDLKSSGHFLSVEGSRRFGDNWLLSLVSRFFFDLPADDPFFSVRDDDYIQLVLAYYF